MEDQLVAATWGLVVATGLLFLASLIPAVGEFRDWRHRRIALASAAVPRVTALRSHALSTRDELLDADGSEPPAHFAQAYYGLDQATESAANLSEIHDLTIEQRLLAQVMVSHANFAGLMLSLLGNEDKRLRGTSTERAARVQRACVMLQALLDSCDEFEKSLLEVRRRFGGRTFTDEMKRLTEDGLVRAEKELVDLRRARKRP